MDKDRFYERVNDLVVWTRKLVEARRKDALLDESASLTCALAALNDFALLMGKAMAETMEGVAGDGASESEPSATSGDDPGRLGEVRGTAGLVPGRAGAGDDGR